MPDNRKTAILNVAVKDSTPARSLANYIAAGDVTEAELISRLEREIAMPSTSEEKKEKLRKKIDAVRGFLVEAKKEADAKRKAEEDRRNAPDHAKWTEVCDRDRVDAYREYLEAYPHGCHAGECQQKIVECDERAWGVVMKQLDETRLNSYTMWFPEGRHIHECEMYLADLPWLKFKAQTPTIDACEQYKRDYPGQHTAEIDAIICDLQDETDWYHAEAKGTVAAYRDYLSKHSKSKHSQQAQNFIDAHNGTQLILDNLKQNRNAYTADQIKQAVGNHKISWEDLQEVFSDVEIKSIRDYVLPTQLQTVNGPDKLLDGNTEVYFWGTPASGKTCAMGALLSAANSYGILSKNKCQTNAGFYRDTLANIFTSDGICVFPTGTPNDSIAEMAISLRDKNDKEHKMAFIDLAGEVFEALHMLQNNQTLDPQKERTLNKTLGYLADERNKKIHFFIVAYGEHGKLYKGLKMQDYLDAMALHLRDNRIIRQSTNAVYILVTKCDNMPCGKNDRAAEAEDYVMKFMPAFYNNMAQICRKAGVKDFQVLPFSTGEVFAQKLCRFDPDNTDFVLNKLILKTPVVRGWWWDFLNA